MKRGYFLSLEGPDGAGKTTQLKRLAAAVARLGYDVLLTREPGGTAVGDAVREILLNPAFGEITPLAEVFLYAAARTQLVRQVIDPALREGKVVLCDRFIDSTLAYQVFGGGMEWDFVLSVNMQAVGGRLPDRTFILDIDPQTGLSRRGSACADRMEQKPLPFHERVRSGFLALAEYFPRRITVIDGTLPQDDVFAEIWRSVHPAVTAL